MNNTHFITIKGFSKLDVNRFPVLICAKCKEPTVAISVQKGDAVCEVHLDIHQLLDKNNNTNY